MASPHRSARFDLQIYRACLVSREQRGFGSKPGAKPKDRRQHSMPDYPESRRPGKAKEKKSKLVDIPKSMRRGPPGRRDDDDNNDPDPLSDEPGPAKAAPLTRASQEKEESLREKQKVLLKEKANLETKLKMGPKGEL